MSIMDNSQYPQCVDIHSLNSGIIRMLSPWVYVLFFSDNNIMSQALENAIVFINTSNTQLSLNGSGFCCLGSHAFAHFYSAWLVNLQQRLTVDYKLRATHPTQLYHAQTQHLNRLLSQVFVHSSKMSLRTRLCAAPHPVVSHYWSLFGVRCEYRMR